MVRRRQAVTIKHVAADAGVSLQTVSRVINSEPNVRPETQKRVQASIDKLGYVPSIAAQRMSGSHSYLILALNDRERTIADWREREGSDWVDQMLFGGMLKCAEHGYRLIFELVDTHNDHVERELSAAFASLQPDGVILTPPNSENPQILAFLAKQQIPFARIGTRTPGPGIAITMDDAGSARKAAEHLLDLGHRRIGFISGSPEFSLSARRTEGWRVTMEEHGLSCEGLLAPGDFSYASGKKAARVLLSSSNPPTAIIASSGDMALATLDVAKALGFSVPEDVSLISFDNTPKVRFIDPPLTVIDQPIAETASCAVELIIEAKKTGNSPAVPTIVHGTLIVRGSTARCRETASR